MDVAVDAEVEAEGRGCMKGASKGAEWMMVEEWMSEPGLWGGAVQADEGDLEGRKCRNIFL